MIMALHQCLTCSKTFSRKDNLARHQRTHYSQNKQVHQCTECKKTFNYQYNLKRHISVVHNIDKHLCEMCGASFTRNDSLKLHLKSHQPNQEQCDICGKSFKLKHHMSRHTATHFSDTGVTFLCYCGQRFSRKDALQRHKLNCTKRTQTTKSKIKRLKTKPSLTTRTRSKVGVQCQICFERFSTNSNLNRHVLSVHRKDTFSCAMCKKTWSRKRKLLTHFCSASNISAPPRTSASRVRAHRSIKKLETDLKNQSPNTKANVADWLIDHSPRTRKLLEQKGRVTTKTKQREQEVNQAIVEDLSEAMEKIKSKRSKPALKLKQKSTAMSIGPRVKKVRGIVTAGRLLSSTKTSTRVRRHGMRDKIIKGEQSAMNDIIRKARAENLNEEQRKLVINHWTSVASHVSTDTTRGTVRKRIGYKTYLEHKRHIMTMTIREGYQHFRENNPNLEISESLYYKLKPFYIQPANKRDLELCCCQRCVIVRKGHRALMDFRRRSGSSLPIYGSVYEMVNASLCPKEPSGYHKISCLKMTCSECGQLDFSPEELSETGTIVWQTLEYVQVQTARTCVKKLKLVSKETPPCQLIDHLKKHLFCKKFALHLFVSRWQREQWQLLKENLSADSMMIDMDFSENFSVIYQEEAQSLHFGKTQCTLHSCVVVRPKSLSDICPSSSSHVKEYWIMISDDLKHDVHFVNHCLNNVIKPQLHALNCNVKSIHQRTDNCASQYKSRFTMMDVSTAIQDLEVDTFIANYSASGHGKSEVDSAAGSVKTQARDAVIKKNVTINDAEELYNFCKESIETKPISEGLKAKPTTLYAKRFFLVSKDEVNRDRELNNNGIKGIQSIHSIRSVGIKGHLEIRELTCYCSECLKHKYKDCVNKDLVQNFRPVSLTGFSLKDSELGEKETENVGDDSQAEDELSQPHEETESPAIENLAALAICNSIVAIKPDLDSIFDYFLVHVTSDGVETLFQPETSDFGQIFPEGSKVIKGHFLEYNGSTPKELIFKQDTKIAILHYESMINCAIDLLPGKGQDEFLLLNEDHEEILDNISV